MRLARLANAAITSTQRIRPVYSCHLAQHRWLATTSQYPSLGGGLRIANMEILQERSEKMKDHDYGDVTATSTTDDDSERLQGHSTRGPVGDATQSNMTTAIDDLLAQPVEKMASLGEEAQRDLITAIDDILSKEERHTIIDDAARYDLVRKLKNASIYMREGRMDLLRPQERDLLDSTCASFHRTDRFWLPKNLHGVDNIAWAFQSWFQNIHILRSRIRNNFEGDIVVHQQARRDFICLLRRMQAQLDTFPSSPNRVPAIRSAVEYTSILQSGTSASDNLKKWSAIMLLAMRYEPSLACDFVQATFETSRVPSFMLASILQVMVLQRAKDVADLLLYILPYYQNNLPRLEKASITCLLDTIDCQIGLDLFERFRETSYPLTSHNYNDFASFFGRHGQYTRGLDSLQLSLQSGGDPSSPYFIRAAAMILRRSILHPNGYQNSNFIISNFVDMGLKIGLHFQTTLIANAFDSKDHGTALNLFSFMESTNSIPDQVTYGAMVKGLRDHEDEALVQGILALSWAKLEETRDPWLAGELLYWHYFRYMRRVHKAKDREEKAKTCLSGLQQLVLLYSATFNATPLEILGFRPFVANEFWSPPSAFSMRPTPFVITLMLMAYFKARVMLRGDFTTGEDILNMHQTWWNVATKPSTYQAEPWIKSVFMETAGDTRIPNICMYALGHDEATVPHVVMIMERMSKGLVNSTEEDGTERAISCLPPDQYSWNIMLNAFANHGQFEAAEKCLNVMRSKSIEPDEVSWNTLIKAHAVAQHIRGAVSAIHRKEQAGFGMDEWLERSLRRVRDNRGLAAVLSTQAEKQDSFLRPHFSDAALLGMGDEMREQKEPWTPDRDAVMAYTPQELQARRKVMYFDANRMQGLRDTGEEKKPVQEDWFEDDEENEKVAEWSPRQGNGTNERGPLRAPEPKNEGDWFEPDEEENMELQFDREAKGFDELPMDDFHGTSSEHGGDRRK